MSIAPSDRDPALPSLHARAWRIVCASVLVVPALFLLLCAQPAVAQGDDTPLSVDEYRARLAAARNELAAGEDLSTVQRDLAAIDEVRLTSGDLLTVRPLLDDVPDVDSALRRLGTVLNQMEYAHTEPTEARLAQLQVVRDRFDLDRPSFWQRILRWLDDLRRALVPDQLPQGAGAAAAIGSRIVVWAVVISGGVLLALLLSYWLRTFFGGILANRLGRSLRNEQEIPASSAEARAQAHSMAGVGNYRAAVRQLYLAALLHLDEQGLLSFQSDQTNREFLAQTSPGSTVRSHLQPAVETFDRVWYGEREPDQSTFESYRAEIDELMAQTGEDTHA